MRFKSKIDLIKNLFEKIQRRQAIIYPNPVINKNLDVFEVDGWIISDFIVKKLVPVVSAHPFPLTELTLMVGAVCWYNPTHLFEWGTHLGKSARVFYEVVKKFGLETKIYTIDLPKGAKHVENIQTDRAKFIERLGPVKRYYGDGVTVALNLARKLEGDKKLMFFLDGDHSYKSVSRELSLITKNFPDSAILVHDAFYQSPESKYNIGPYRAVHELLGKNPSKYKAVSMSISLPGMVFLYPNWANR